MNLKEDLGLSERKIKLDLRNVTSRGTCFDIAVIINGDDIAYNGGLYPKVKADGVVGKSADEKALKVEKVPNEQNGEEEKNANCSLRRDDNQCDISVTSAICSDPTISYGKCLLRRLNQNLI